MFKRKTSIPLIITVSIATRAKQLLNKTNVAKYLRAKRLI